MDQHCVGCAHYRAQHKVNLMCHYIFDTGHRRPCPPGRGCRVFCPKENNHEKSTEHPQNEEKIV